jgi:predicted CoA-binding protein
MSDSEEQLLQLPDLSRDEIYVVYGVSRLRMGYGYRVAKLLQHRGFTFFVAHPITERIGPWYTIKHVTSLDRIPDAAIICSPPDSAMGIFSELSEAGVPRAYAWKGSVTEPALMYARSEGLDVVVDCPLLHMPRAGFPHNLHRGWMRHFGRNGSSDGHAGPPAMAP